MLALQIGAAVAGLMAAPHCAGMCGALVAGLGSRSHELRTVWSGKLALLGGRVLSYTLVGALLGLFSQNLLALLQTTSWLRPLWLLLQCSAMVLGFWVLLTGSLPRQVSEVLQRSSRSLGRNQGASVAIVMGLGWGLIPCGVLQAVYLMAMMTGDPLQGAITMLAFALTSSLALGLGGWLWSRLLAKKAPSHHSSDIPQASGGNPLWSRWLRGVNPERVMYRITGAAMGSVAAWGIYHGVINLMTPGGGATGVQCT